MQVITITIQIYFYAANLIFTSYVSCGHGSVQDVAEKAIEPVNVSSCQHHKVGLSRTDRGSLTGLGGVAVDIVKTLANDRDSRDVNIKDLTELVTALAESAVLMNNPKEAAINLNLKLAVKLNILEEKVNEELGKFTTENQELKKKLAQFPQRAGVAAYLSASLSSSSSTRVIFNIVTSVQGDYYDDALGAFTCPVDGDYFVSSTLRKSSSRTSSSTYNSGFYRQPSTSSSSWSMSIKQSAGKQIAYAAEDSNEYGGTLSTSAVVHCPALSKIWVKISGSVTIKGDNKIPYSSFNVYLLKVDVI